MNWKKLRDALLNGWGTGAGALLAGSLGRNRLFFALQNKHDYFTACGTMSQMAFYVGPFFRQNVPFGESSQVFIGWTLLSHLFTSRCRPKIHFILGILAIDNCRANNCACN